MSKETDSRRTLSRREFFAWSAAATAALAYAPQKVLAAQDNRFHPIPSSPLPTRAYGKTGARNPILTFGCGSRWLMYKEEDQALAVLSQAIDAGITFLDSAHNYGKGMSEERIGKLMPARRKEVLIQTKIGTRDKELWWGQLETSLKRLNVEYVDMLLIHQLEHDDDLEKIEEKGGALELLYRAKEQKLTRWVGFSSHTDGSTAAKFLRRHEVDGIQIALNVATNGPYDIGHEESALPVAVEKGVGVTAMKVMGQDNIANKYEDFPAETCLRYSLSLPVTAATVGMQNPEYLQRNLDLVRNFKPFSPEEMLKLKTAAEGEVKTSFFEGLRGHSDLA